MLCKGEVVLHKKFICKNLTVLQYKIYKTEKAVIANRQSIYIKKDKKGSKVGNVCHFLIDRFLFINDGFFSSICFILKVG